MYCICLHHPPPHTPPRLATAPPSATVQAGITALVFGREESGLTEEELRLCSHACAVPSGRVHPSLNLSHAVAVVLAQMFERCMVQRPPRP